MSFLNSFLNGIHNELIVMGIAATPVLELRASIPFGMSMDMDWKLVYILSILGNLIPIPFIILFMRPLFYFLRKTKYCGDFICWMENRTMKKAEKVIKYSVLGLFLLVAIPLPGTGAWTGAMVASILDMRMKYALPAIFMGVITAGILVMSISYHII